MAKYLEDFVLDAKNIGFEYIFFNTNGALAEKERMSKLFANGLNSIKFSINAGKAETYKKVHGRDDFQKVIAHIKAAAELRALMGVDVGIFVSFAESLLSQGEGRLLEEIIGNIVDNIYITKAVNQGGGMYEEVQQGIVSQEETLWGRYKKNDTSIIVGNVCPYPFKRISITAEGYVTACCADPKNELVVADLNQVSLKEAWNCDTMKVLRSWHLENRIPKTCKCYNCINGTNNTVEPLITLVERKKYE